jgi:hypothetical protein
VETAEMANNGFGDLTKLYQRRALAALPRLVRQAKAGQTIYYSELAAELGMPNPRNLNFPLGAVGREMEKLSQRLGTRIPPIQCLVINKQEGIPGEGIGWFVGDVNKFKKSSPTEKRRVIDSMLFEIFQFPDWDMVLAEYGIKPIVVSSEATLRQEAVAAVSRYGRGGEGDPHRTLKEFVSWRGRTPFPIGRLLGCLVQKWKRMGRDRSEGASFRRLGYQPRVIPVREISGAHGGRTEAFTAGSKLPHGARDCTQPVPLA